MMAATALDTQPDTLREHPRSFMAAAGVPDEGCRDQRVTLVPCDGWLDATVERGLARAGFTRRQKEVVRLKVKGQTASEVAWALFICEDTARNHMWQACQRAGVQSGVQLLRWLLELGMQPEEVSHADATDPDD